MIRTVTLDQPPSLLKLLAHELRWKLVKALTYSDYRVQELVALLKEPQNLVSYHLKQLRDVQLLTERRSAADARDIYYSLNLNKLHQSYNAIGYAIHPALFMSDAGTGSGRDEPIKQHARVLFLCTENSARSQMAEGILKHLGGQTIESLSAGTAPSAVHPHAIRVMAEMGIDISQQRTKHVDELAEYSFDYVITVCDRARESCPVFQEDTQAIHWSFGDPAAVSGNDAQYQAFFQTAQQLMTRIRYFLAQLQQQKDELQ